MAEPLRCTDQEVADLARALAEHGEDSPEARAALAICTQRLADWIDDQVAQKVYAQLFREQSQAYDRRFREGMQTPDAIDPSEDADTHR